MKKYGKRSLTIIAAVLLLLFVLLPISQTNSWFTAGKDLKLECEIEIADFNYNVYQHFNSNNTDRLINGYEGQDGKTYVDLTNENNISVILPDVSYDLNLVIKNEDLGNIALYLRYKIMLVYKDSSGSEKYIEMDVTTGDAEQNNYFAKNEDGYYYYQNQDGDNQIFAKGSSATIMTSFVVPYSEFYNLALNNYGEISGANVRLRLVIEGSDTAAF